MALSLKCQYALRALFDLARFDGEGMRRITEIAEEQDIPPRYLENICNQLRQGGFVEGKRGKDGGFALARSARDIRVGDVIRFIEGPLHPVTCGTDSSPQTCRFTGQCVFKQLWDKAEKALESVYDSTSLADLVEEERKMATTNDYCI